MRRLRRTQGYPTWRDIKKEITEDEIFHAFPIYRLHWELTESCPRTMTMPFMCLWTYEVLIHSICIGILPGVAWNWGLITYGPNTQLSKGKVIAAAGIESLIWKAQSLLLLRLSWRSLPRSAPCPWSRSPWSMLMDQELRTDDGSMRWEARGTPNRRPYVALYPEQYRFEPVVLVTYLLNIFLNFSFLMTSSN